MLSPSQIIIHKSIKAKRVVRKINGTLLIEYTLMYFFVAMILSFAIRLIFFRQPQDETTPLFSIVVGLLAVFMLFNLYFRNKLVSVNSNSSELIIELLKEKYPNVKHWVVNKPLITGGSPETSNHRSKLIIGIIDDDRTYINGQTVFKDGLWYFDGFYNYIKCRAVAKHFR
ncbi:hypothetical protein [Mucilaginibacter pedocola]|uniref:Uncharacterized protein n=1 Tax=Mucilaginibacter pedocola TaxID=1792845 RepID=A0A1S9PB41_9SPHI|nr:hypothetical protein [Mucilaginibacter pedocola]OOQ58196.1 hypothetical protein BC343_11155 [Mucilaginibacter pedocola]